MLPTASILPLLFSALQLAVAGNTHANNAEGIIQRSPAHPHPDAAQLSRRQAVSPQCGPAGGNRRCPNNLCCSDYGYCGEKPDYCDVRWCQVQFGRCGDAPPPPPPPTTTTTSGTTTTTSTTTATRTTTATSPPVPTGSLVASINGQCGNSTTCAGSPFGSCCSEYYWCGSGAEYCGVGCRGSFGTCGDGSVPLPPPGPSTSTSTVPSSSTSTSTSTSTTVPRPSNASTNGRCGVDAGRFTCTGTNYGPCCSDYGWCGDGPDYCTPLYCQADYGTCG
ncbi:hypothetical protein MGG_08729 [Pyricularia oryzae 70-15]|uniref:Chitin-binding type-1 domain-containing protein n=1 Tax=Pyricularia oryzae (strain 70-15 / ATCC MYA-4617 / FGSC 8958) TaxID=242507 RepID=G4NFT3_PYRO7|nr:uncharacterized protein MGG_08729 [Pyricularia oryzae 70-15]EHA46890.1 hypothetical protein MGG_08729 [Pyricularia oryzae 70-15]KAI7921670.1 hypothetical protein M0657_005985 [Pyricularia oryzae]KAI7926145.1 hypothetical protein M9X92_002890 [Pyricularia oryzae]